MILPKLALAQPLGLCVVIVAIISLSLTQPTTNTSAGQADLPSGYSREVRPLLKKYCLDCHSTAAKKGSLDLERFATVADIKDDLKPWQGLIEMLENGEMPPKNRPQPNDSERKALIEWTKALLESEARSKAGDPGDVPLRRLSNAEYNATIRDLTGVDLQPAREFPADGAAGEGFTNAAEALTEISPALFSKYLAAAKSLSDQVVLLPEGFRFSRFTTRRDWTDESVARLRQFYAAYPSDGSLPLRPYLVSTIRHRDSLLKGITSLQTVADQEKLNAKYLGILWNTLNARTPSLPLDQIRESWMKAGEADVESVLKVIHNWQKQLWKTVNIGSYADNATMRQVPVDPSSGETRLVVSTVPEPGQEEVALRLTSRNLSARSQAQVLWQRPRFEPRTPATAGAKTLLLKDYHQYGPALEVNYYRLFSSTEKYLAAVTEAANAPGMSRDVLAEKYQLDSAFLQRWMELAPVKPSKDSAARRDLPGRIVPLKNVTLLEEKTPANPERPAINGWHARGSDLPVVISNSSDKSEQIPGRISAHGLAVHPMPQEFVAVNWKSPMAGLASITAKVAHAHPACGNGVAWRLEHRRDGTATVMADGVLDLGKSAQIEPLAVRLEKGDQVLLVVDARDGNHVCDLTEIALTITEREKPSRVWDLARDVANSIQDGNPHADTLGNKEVWSFVRGPSRPELNSNGSRLQIPAGSLLDRWLAAASDMSRPEESLKLAAELQKLLTGKRPVNDKDPDRLLFDRLVSCDSKLLEGLDLGKLSRTPTSSKTLGLVSERFGPVDGNSLLALGDSVIEIRLPAGLFADHTFVVDCRLEPAQADSLLQVEITAGEMAKKPLDALGGKLLVGRETATHRELLQGFAEFRRTFPLYLCFPHVIPVDEVVCLKLFHREDEPLKELFLSPEQVREIDHLWDEHRFISQWPLTENKNLPLFIGFVTQDQSKETLKYFEGLREPFRVRAEAFEKEWEAASTAQLRQLLQFAKRAFRHPLGAAEQAQLNTLYWALRKRGSSHEEAFRGVMARIFVSPAFLFRIESPPDGATAGSVSEWELATRLSYFLWSSLPDFELERLAAAGRLHEPAVLVEQTRRMLRDDRVRSLAIEFGTQWIHVRAFHEFNEKNEKLFPTFDMPLRNAISEESIRFFEYLFRENRPVTDILDADYTFLNERLANHYGIPGVRGEQWRKVDGVNKYGRGGILGLASVQARQSGASRTSPVLRGNWVVETLLGEKLPRPPANVPRLPEEEGSTNGLTVRQLVEKHAQQEECAVCHRRIDPFGFALEKYDPIGRARDKDLGGLAVDCTAKLKDGTQFEGIDGLRNYLLTRKKAVFIRLFSRRLLGYALGRATTLSDDPLIDKIAATLESDGHIGEAILEIVKSAQFNQIRGREFRSNR